MPNHHRCPQSPDHRLSRRQLLFGSGAAPAFLAAARSGDAQVRSAAGVPRNTAKACIFINLAGAPSQLDTFDPKDGAWNPSDADIREVAPRMLLSRSFFPQLSARAADLLVLRSVESWELAHERGNFYVQTAHPSNPAFLAESPHIGSVISAEKTASGILPPFLAINSGVMQGAKFLNGIYEPLSTVANAGGLTTLEHNYYGANSRARFEEKFKLLDELDADWRNAPPNKATADHAAFYAAARKLVYEPTVAAVFRFTTDENSQYGNTNLGRACLVARNAIRAKAGTSFLNIDYGNWDTHQSMFDRGYNGNMYQLTNQLDTAVGQLVDDLKQSGDLSSTLIVIMGEFGRTPGQLNSRGGRDHHRFAMSVAMLGGGVRGGRAIGETDRESDQIITPGWSAGRPIYMEDIAATIYSAMGIDWTKALTNTPSGRRFEYVPYSDQGRFQPVDEVFG
jgi:hypothetical protein